MSKRGNPNQQELIKQLYDRGFTPRVEHNQIWIDEIDHGMTIYETRFFLEERRCKRCDLVTLLADVHEFIDGTEEFICNGCYDKETDDGICPFCKQPKGPEDPEDGNCLICSHCGPSGM